MILKALKYTVLGGAAALIIGGLAFGAEMFSYARSSSRSISRAVKHNVPVEFELQRARDLMNDILPEMQANIRAIAEQEVEIASLRGEIKQSEQALADQKDQVVKLRQCLQTAQANFTVGRLVYSRQEMKDELARRFDAVREAELAFAGKQRLLSNREKSLAAAVQLFERSKAQRAQIESQIAALEAQHKLVQAAAVGSGVQVDHSKLAQTQHLLAQIKKQLDVAERVLAHESKFVEPMRIEGEVEESDLLAEVDAYLAAPTAEAKADGTCPAEAQNAGGGNGTATAEPAPQISRADPVR